MNIVSFSDLSEDHTRFIPGNLNESSNSRRSSLRIRVDVLNNALQNLKMEEDINNSKQAVVKHILHARGLSDDLSIYGMRNDDCLEISKFSLNKVNDLGNKVLRLDQDELSSIESQSGTIGHGEHLLNLLNNYEDRELSTVLESLPGNFVHFLFLRTVKIISFEFQHFE